MLGFSYNHLYPGWSCQKKIRYLPFCCGWKSFTSVHRPTAAVLCDFACIIYFVLITLLQPLKNSQTQQFGKCMLYVYKTPFSVSVCWYYFVCKKCTLTTCLAKKSFCRFFTIFFFPLNEKKKKRYSMYMFFPFCYRVKLKS